MSGQHMCHLTVLNPAIHTRIFYKLALSQLALGYEVSIIGQDSQPAPYFHRGIRIIPIGSFPRKSFRRLLVGWRILRLAKRTKADLFTLHTPELLWVGFMLRFFFGKKVVYDVHEDYAANFLNRKPNPGFFRKALAAGIRKWERFSTKWLAGIAYAEFCYDNILNAPEAKTVILRNSFTERALEGGASISLPTASYMLYTGTIVKEWGIWETLDLWQKINTTSPLHLVVAGFTFNKNLIKELNRWVASSGLQKRFTLIGGTEYVPYSDIVHLIQNCLFGTAFYHPLPHIRENIPTKFYDFMAFSKPLLFTRDSFWVGLNDKWGFGMPLTLENGEVTDVFDLINLPTSSPPREAFSWEVDEKKMREWLARITSESGQKPR